MLKPRFQNGFTLIEIAIVLFIVALLIGGGLGVTQFLRAQSVRATVFEGEQYIAAVSQFRQKYQYLPGDMPRSACEKYFEPASSTGSCWVDKPPNTGNNVMGNGGGAAPYEYNLAWAQLFSAGYIKIKPVYTASPWECRTGNHGASIASKELLWWVGFMGNAYQGTFVLTNPYSTPVNVMTLYRANSSSCGSGTWNTYGALTIAEARAMDSKVDDGLAAGGKMRVNGPYDGGSTAVTNGQSCTTWANPTLYNTAQASNTTNWCNPFFIIP